MGLCKIPSDLTRQETWETHLINKLKQFNIKFKKLKGRHSELILTNKLIYTAVFRPVRTEGYSCEEPQLNQIFKDSNPTCYAV